MQNPIIASWVTDSGRIAIMRADRSVEELQ